MKLLLLCLLFVCLSLVHAKTTLAKDSFVYFASGDAPDVAAPKAAANIADDKQWFGLPPLHDIEFYLRGNDPASVVKYQLKKDVDLLEISENGLDDITRYLDATTNWEVVVNGAKYGDYTNPITGKTYHAGSIFCSSYDIFRIVFGVFGGANKADCVEAKGTARSAERNTNRFELIDTEAERMSRTDFDLTMCNIICALKAKTKLYGYHAGTLYNQPDHQQYGPFMHPELMICDPGTYLTPTTVLMAKKQTVAASFPTLTPVEQDHNNVAPPHYRFFRGVDV